MKDILDKWKPILDAIPEAIKDIEKRKVKNSISCCWQTWEIGEEFLCADCGYHVGADGKRIDKLV